jgi:putative nucleotidyltransferase with HDIG domain
MITRDEAWEMLNEHCKNPNLIKHALAVEAAMRHYAKMHDEDEELWGIVGLIHDFDYEQFDTMETHAIEGAKILREKGWPEEIVQGMLAHADHTGEPRDTLMKKCIFAVDELAGFVVACSLVRPDKIEGLKAKSVKKRMKDKAFARQVNRDDITRGAELLDLQLDDHIQNVIDSMMGIRHDLGLQAQ